MLAVETVGMCNMCFKEEICEKRKAGVIGCDQFAKKIKTNYDKTRAMSIKEMAKWLDYICDAWYCPTEGWLDWLNREVRE